MNIQKNITGLLFYAISMATVLTSCKQPADAPTAVLDGMFTAMQNGNIDTMKNFITKGDIAMLEAAEKFLITIDPEGIKKIKDRITSEMKDNVKQVTYNFKNEKINGDHATVETEIVQQLPDSAGGEKRTTHTFELVKEDNAWKIALTRPGNEMFNSMKGNLGNKDRGIKDGLEKLKQMDKDSLKMIISKGLQAMDSIDSKKQDQP